VPVEISGRHSSRQMAALTLSGIFGKKSSCVRRPPGALYQYCFRAEPFLTTKSALHLPFLARSPRIPIRLSGQRSHRRTTQRLLSERPRIQPTGWPIDQACPLLLAAPGREPTDSATVWDHGPADRLAALARRVGGPQIGADFGGERGRGRKSVRGTGRRRVSFEIWDSAERQYWPFPWLVQGPSTDNSSGD